MTRPIKKARVTRRRKYYGGGKKRGGTTLKKVGGSGGLYNAAVAPQQEPNEYATWTVALRSLIHNSDYDDLVIARNKEGDEITLKEWKENIQTGEGFPNLKEIKNYDLGGGDQTKFKKLIKTKEDEGESKDWLLGEIRRIKKGYFIDQKGTLITGGTEANRLVHLKEFIEEGILNTDSYALIPGMETKLTAISYYDKACKLLNDQGFISYNPQLKTLCLIPVGSTDAHIITYKKKKGEEKVIVEHETYCEFAKENAIPIKLEQCDKYIFAGSGPFYIDTPNGWADRHVAFQKKLEKWQALGEKERKEKKEPEEDDWTNVLKPPDQDIPRDVFEESNFESNKDYWEHGVMVNNNKKVKDFKTLLAKIIPVDIIFKHYENADREKIYDIIEIPDIFAFTDKVCKPTLHPSVPGPRARGRMSATASGQAASYSEERRLAKLARLRGTGPTLQHGGKLSRRRKTDKKKNKRVTKKSRKSRKSGK